LLAPFTQPATTTRNAASIDARLRRTHQSSHRIAPGPVETSERQGDLAADWLQPVRGRRAVSRAGSKLSVMADGRTPAQYAADIADARDRLIAFVESCTAPQWRAAPLEGDPRPVGVVADHVAHAYEYLASWMHQTLSGQPVTVNSDLVDALNAEHAAAAAAVTKADAVARLRHSGAAISSLVAGCTAADLKAGDGRVERLAQIAVRHADAHRTEMEAALAALSDERQV
jgi:hypothetical protein